MKTKERNTLTGNWNHLTLRQKIGQTMLMPPDRTRELALGRGSLKTFFARYPVTGFYMGWKLFDGVAEADKVAHVRKSVVEYQAASAFPLLFQEDYENGVSLSGMTPFPTAMALGAAQDHGVAATIKHFPGAGVDILLWPSYEFMDEVERRIRRGTIPMTRLDDAVRRVGAMKQRFGLLESDVASLRPMSAEERKSVIRTARQVAETAVTLVRDRGQALPLNPAKDKKILLVGVVPVSRKGGDGGFSRLRGFKRCLEQRGFSVTLQRNILYETQGWESDAPDRYDRILFAVLRSPHNPFGPLQLWDDEAQTAWGINAMPKKKIIVISLGSPYIVDEYFERVGTCINAYSNDAATHAALVKALAGDIPFKGVSPVSLRRPSFAMQKPRGSRQPV